MSNEAITAPESPESPESTAAEESPRLRPRREKPAAPDAGEILAEALPSAPPELLDALGGAPVAVPSQRAGRVVARPVHRPRPGTVDAPSSDAAPAPGVPGRIANPLFDAPAKAVQTASADIRRLRSALGSAAIAMDAAVELHALAVAGDLAALRDAAAREGFDLDAAGAVVGEIRAFLDRHKPQAGAE